MRVTINENKTGIIVERLDSKKVYKDSTLMTWVRRDLQSKGYDCIMKDLSKEPGNMLSSGCYGIIDRKRRYQIHYPLYQIRNMYTDYNIPSGFITLYITGDLTC